MGVIFISKIDSSVINQVSKSIKFDKEKEINELQKEIDIISKDFYSVGAKTYENDLVSSKKTIKKPKSNIETFQNHKNSTLLRLKKRIDYLKYQIELEELFINTLSSEEKTIYKFIKENEEFDRLVDLLGYSYITLKNKRNKLLLKYIDFFNLKK